MEIVIALGILAFSITALIGALSLGITTNRESIEELQATHILQSMLTERRARPTLADTNLILPVLNSNSSRPSLNPVPLDMMGRSNASLQSAKFGLVYRIATNNGGSADVYCAIYWPSQVPASNAVGRVEIATKVALPPPAPSTP